MKNSTAKQLKSIQKAFEKKKKGAKWKLRLLKLRITLLVTLPIAVVVIGHAVLKEYVKVKVKKAAIEARPQRKKKETGSEEKQS